MARLIDADKIENRFVSWLGEISKDITNDTYQGSESDGIAVCLEEIRGAPTIDPESLRPRAHWEKETVDGPDVVKYTSLLSVFCSRCGLRAWTKSNYCPHCGAKIEDERNGKTD